MITFISSLLVAFGFIAMVIDGKPVEAVRSGQIFLEATKYVTFAFKFVLNFRLPLSALS
jgi:hypothetical protein